MLAKTGAPTRFGWQLALAAVLPWSVFVRAGLEPLRVVEAVSSGTE